MPTYTIKSPDGTQSWDVARDTPASPEELKALVQKLSMNVGKPMTPSLDRPADQAAAARAAGERSLTDARQTVTGALPLVGAAAMTAATGGASWPLMVGAAGLGGAGGEAYRQLMGIPFGEEEKSSGEAAKKIFLEGRTQALGELGGQVAGHMIRGAVNIPWRKLVARAQLPENQAVIKAAENLGIADKLTVAEATGFKPFQAIQDVSGRSLVGKGPAIERAKALHDGVVNVVNNTADKIAAATSVETGGAAMKEAVGPALRNSIKAEGARIYAPLDEAMAGAPVDLGQVSSLVKSHFAQGEAAAKIAPSVSGRSAKMLAMGEDFGVSKASAELDKTLENFPPDVANMIRQSLRGGVKKTTVDVTSRAAPKVAAEAVPVAAAPVAAKAAEAPAEISRAEIMAAAKEWDVHPVAAERELQRLKDAGLPSGLPKALPPEEARLAAIEAGVKQINDEARLKAADEGLTIEQYNKVRTRKDMTPERYIAMNPSLAPPKGGVAPKAAVAAPAPAPAAKAPPAVAPAPAVKATAPSAPPVAPGAPVADLKWEDSKVILSDLKRMVRDESIPRDAQILAKRIIPVLDDSMGEAAKAAGKGTEWAKAQAEYKSLKQLANDTVIPRLLKKDPAIVSAGIQTAADVRAVRRATIDVNKDPKAFEMFQRQRVQDYIGDPDAVGEVALHKIGDNLKRAGKDRLAEEFSTPAGKVMLQNMRDVATVVDRVAALKAHASGGDVMLGKFKEAADVNALAQMGLKGFSDLIKPSTASDKAVKMISRGAREVGGLIAAPLMNRVISNPEATRKLIAGIDLLSTDKFAGLAQIARAGLIAVKGIKAGSELMKSSHQRQSFQQPPGPDLRPPDLKLQDQFAKRRT